MQIRIERGELYDLELPDFSMSRLLELLMRKYTGIFSYPVPIDEDYVSGQIGVTVPQLRQLLYRLSLEHVIKYVPCDHATVLYLHHERLRPKNVNLDPERYELLKDSAHKRMQKMLDYINEDDVCRSAYLLEYFGQTESTACGTCDVCRASAAMERELVSFINDEMQGTYTFDEAVRRFGSPTSSVSDSYITVLRRLIDEGTVPPPASV